MDKITIIGAAIIVLVFNILGPIPGFCLVFGLMAGSILEKLEN